MLVYLLDVNSTSRLFLINLLTGAAAGARKVLYCRAVWKCCCSNPYSWLGSVERHASHAGACTISVFDKCQLEKGWVLQLMKQLLLGSH